MLTPASPVLSDGTRIDDLINLATREVQMRTLSDPELYELEMERIFGRIWVFLGHESEVPNSGDFIVRDMGSDSVLITRDKSGAVHVMLNMCTHRGMRVSTLDAGNTQIHTCIYHGWAFKPNGDFLGAPVEKEQMHGKLLPKSDRAKFFTIDGYWAALRKFYFHIFGRDLYRFFPECDAHDWFNNFK